MVGVKSEVFAIPIVTVEEALWLTEQDVHTIESHAVIRLRGKTIPLTHLSDLVGEPGGTHPFTDWSVPELELPAPRHPGVSETLTFDSEEAAVLEPEHAPLCAVVITDSEQQLGVLIDRLIGENDIVITALNHDLLAVDGVSGASIQPDGRVALVLDAASLIQLAHRRKRGGVLESWSAGVME
jgi:two-component system chemotaxis sensor kinase CheA